MLLFGITSFLGAFPLFQVQPLIVRHIPSRDYRRFSGVGIGIATDRYRALVDPELERLARKHLTCPANCRSQAKEPERNNTTRGWVKMA